MAGLASVPGWIGLLTAAVAAGWYVRHTLSGHLLHVLGCLLLGVGVLAACHAGRVETPAIGISWLAYHVLTTAWAAAAVVLLGLAMLAEKVGPRAFRLLSAAGRDAIQHRDAIRPSVQGWITGIGAAAVALAVVHSLHDPLRPWWSVRATLAVGMAAGMVALWLRRPAYVYFSGLLLNVAGTILWWSWADASIDIFQWDLGTVSGLVAANVICLAIGSVAWSLLRLAHAEGVPHIGRDGRVEPAAHVAVQFGVCLLGILVAVCVAHELLGLHPAGPQRLEWIALAAIAAAALVCLGSGLGLPVSSCRRSMDWD